jgi:hypothetical protein
MPINTDPQIATLKLPPGTYYFNSVHTSMHNGIPGSAGVSAGPITVTA